MIRKIAMVALVQLDTTFRIICFHKPPGPAHDGVLKPGDHVPISAVRLLDRIQINERI